jgi:hypothetical protein
MAFNPYARGDQGNLWVVPDASDGKMKLFQ